MDGDDPQDTGDARPAIGDALATAGEPDDPTEADDEAGPGASAWRWL